MIRGITMWSDEDKALLRELWPSMGIKCADRFPGRSRNAIEQRAGLLGLVRVWKEKPKPKFTHWTKKEDALLQSLWPKFGAKAAECFPERSLKAVMQRAYMMNLTVNHKTGPKRTSTLGYGSLPEGRVASVWDFGGAL